MNANTLKGLNVLNTRPQEQGKKLSTEIIKLGGQVISLPTIEIESLNPDWLDDILPLEQYQKAIFISTNAVTHALEPLVKKNISWPPSLEIFAIGEQTQARLESYQLSVSDKPDIEDSEHFIQMLALKEVTEEKIIIFKGVGGRQLITKTLKERHARPTPVPVYQRVQPTYDKSFIHGIWNNQPVDIILVTSEQGMINLFDIFGEKARHWLKSKVFMVISKRLAAIAKDMGIDHIIVSSYKTVLDRLHDYNQGLIHGQ